MPIPRDTSFDSTFAMLREGYDFISNRCDRLGSDAFLTRFMLRPVYCLRGAEAAEMFYHPDRFSRQAAMPQFTLRLLQDKGSVRQLQGAAHRHRKAMFMSILLDESRIDALTTAFREEWQRASAQWFARGEILFFDEIFPVVTRAVAHWAGLPQEDAQSVELCSHPTDKTGNAAGLSPASLRVLLRRRRAEKRMAALITQVRSGALQPPAYAALSVIAHHRDREGALLPPDAAAVELINILRPVVAVSRYLVFTAMALDDHPKWQARFASGDETGLEGFTEEVRRVYPFFPFVGGRALADFDWRGNRFRKGDWVLLDLFGTNRDPARFAQGSRLDPMSAPSWKDQDWGAIAQGGGDAQVSHRCPGEAITLALMMETARLLTRSMTYSVPVQDKSLDRAVIPTGPKSGFRLTGLQRAG